jgi:SAM-dependent methyltransferase
MSKAERLSALSGKRYWDDVHQNRPTAASGAAAVERRHEPFRRGMRQLKKLVSPRWLERSSAYDDYLLWESLFPRLLPDLAGSNILEVGSAPGKFLVKFSQRYGCVPYGVEYSETGAQANRTLFAASGYNPDNVICADFFSETFLNAYAGRFDLVISRGFIEHFTDVSAVIDRHASLLAPNGHLVISIPNLRGLNYALVRFFHPEVIAIHNLEIMKKDAFAKLFERDDLEPLFCDFYGTFSFYVFNAQPQSPRRHAMNAAYRLQPLLNLGFRSVFGDRGCETAFCSPYLLYVGRRRSSAGSSMHHGLALQCQPLRG